MFLSQPSFQCLGTMISFIYQLSGRGKFAMKSSQYGFSWPVLIPSPMLTTSILLLRGRAFIESSR